MLLELYLVLSVSKEHDEQATLCRRFCRHIGDENAKLLPHAKSGSSIDGIRLNAAVRGSDSRLRPCGVAIGVRFHRPSAADRLDQPAHVVGR